jgi:hypothetical protein
MQSLSNTTPGPLRNEDFCHQLPLHLVVADLAVRLIQNVNLYGRGAIIYMPAHLRPDRLTQSTVQLTYLEEISGHRIKQSPYRNLWRV